MMDTELQKMVEMDVMNTLSSEQHLISRGVRPTSLPPNQVLLKTGNIFSLYQDLSSLSSALVVHLHSTSNQKWKVRKYFKKILLWRKLEG